MITIYFHAIREQPSKDRWAPMVTVSLSVPSKAAGEPIVVPNVVAMIDTGSDSCRIDDDLASQYSIPVIGRSTSYSMGNPIEVNVYRCSIIFDRSAQLQADLGGAQFQQQKNHFSLLLGMQALQFFDFSMSSAEQKAVLHWRD
jgi:hypothetical protein